MSYELYKNNERLKAAAFRYFEIIGINPEATHDGDLLWWMIAKDIAHHMAMAQAITETEPSVIGTPMFIPHEVAEVVNEGVDEFWQETNQEVYTLAKKQIEAMKFAQFLAEHVASSDWDSAVHVCDDARNHFASLRKMENEAADNA